MLLWRNESMMSSLRMLAIVLTISIPMSGCVLWDIVKPSQGLSVETEIVAGDKNQEAEIALNKETTNNTADAINQTYNTVNEQYPWWVVLLLILGWVLPEPRSMGSWLINKIWRKKDA